MATVNLDDAKAHLPEIISGLNPGEQVVIVKNGEPPTFQNTVEALEFIMKTFGPLRKRMYIVALTDEEGDDTKDAVRMGTLLAKGAAANSAKSFWSVPSRQRSVLARTKSSALRPACERRK
jgi:hypothetical protein